MRTTLRRPSKDVDELDDKEIRARLAAAEATVREIDALPPAKVRGREKDVLGRYEKALEMVDLGRAELATRELEHIAATAPLRRAARDEEDARRAKHKTLAPVVGALNFVRARAHPELAGATLAADRLTDTEGEELVALVSKARRVAYDENAPSLNPEEVARYEVLCAVATGDAEAFTKARREREVRETIRELGDKRRLAALPERPKLAEPGSIELPRFVHSWLVTNENRDGRFTVMDLGVLAALLFAFENQDASVVAGARFEEVDDELVLVIPGGVGSELRFARALGGSSLSDPAESGHVRLRPALRNLVANKWLVTEVTTAEIRVRLGEHAKRLRGGVA